MIDLLPVDYYKKGNLDKEKIIYLVLALITVSIIIFYGFLYTQLIVEASRTAEKSSLASSKVAELREQTREISSLEDKNQLLEDTLKKRAEISLNRLEWPLILLELSRLRPEQGWFEDFNFEQESGLKLSAYTLKQEQLSDVVNSLRNSAYFNNIALDFVRKERRLIEEVREGEKVIYYQLSADLVNTREEADDYR